MLKATYFRTTFAVTLLLVATFIPNAIAAKPIPSLNSKICKSLGGSWVAGKQGICEVRNSGAVNNISFEINAGDSLSILTNFTFRNNMSIVNNGYIYNLGGLIVNYGEITNNNYLNNALSTTPIGRVHNYGVITNNGYVNNYNSLISNCGSGIWIGNQPNVGNPVSTNECTL
jgi:hypothetical protein